MEFKIDAQPFSWTDKLAETAIEDFEAYQKDMSYGASSSIGIALAKLKMIEEGYLVELPCKPGDTVYVLRNSWDGWKIDVKKFSYSMIGKIGKTVFPNYQEALEALEGMKK